MAWSFRKRIKIAPGVNINLSKSGVSTSVGPKGAKVTIGPKGTYLHTSIPGTGIYSRKRISPASEKASSSTLGSVGSPSKKSPKQSSNKKGCLHTFIMGLFLLSLLGSAGAVSAVYDAKKELKAKSSHYNELSALSSERESVANKEAEVSQNENKHDEVDGAIETNTPLETELPMVIEELKKDFRWFCLVLVLFLVLLLFSSRWLLIHSSVGPKIISLFRPNSTALPSENGTNLIIEKLRGEIASTNVPEKILILNDILGHAINDDAEMRLKVLVEKWRRKIERNPSSQNEEQLRLYEEQFMAAKKEAEHLIIDFDTVLGEREKNNFKRFCDAFQSFMNCDKTWEIVSSARNSELKSSAYTTVQKAPICLKMSSFPYLTTSFKVPVFPSRSKGLCYFYPKFVICGESIDDFEVYSIDKVTLKYRSTRFIEEGIRPTDAKQVDTTYKYVNKDGGPDRRYSYNPVIPVFLYGDITIQPFGDTYQVSNDDAAKQLDYTFRVLKEGNIFKDIIHSDQLPITPLFSGEKDRDEIVSPNDETISEQYFNYLLDATKRLLEFGNRLSTDKDFCKIVGSSVSGTIKWNGRILTEPRDKVPILLLVDVLHCYQGLGHDLNLSSNEGLGLLLYNTLMINPDFPLEYRYLGFIRKSLIEPAEKFVRDSVASMAGNEDVFVLEVCLKEHKKQLHNQYVVLLYRFASLIAKADKSITTTESNWLNKIMSLKEPEGEQDIISPIEPTEKPKETAATKSSHSQAMRELNSLIGLTSVKTEINTLSNYIRIQKKRAEKGMKVSPVSYHCVFTGNPGTGKTTVARIVSKIYKELGILKKGHLIETDRSGLVAEYVGQTAIKTNKIIDSALDGILFIDEAYSLVDGGNSDYGKEAIATLLKRMEDERDRLIVILAGYTNDMRRFIESNPGLQSRFNRYIEFPDYSAEELFQIFESSTKKYDYKLTDAATLAIKEVLIKAVEVKDKHFGNGRYVRNLFERVIEHQANRISLVADISAESLATIEEEDILKSV